MNEHPVSILRREVALAEQIAAMWQRAAYIMVGVALVSMLITLITIYIGTKTADELLAYKDNCVSPSVGTSLLRASEQVSKVNKLCIKSHERHIDVLKTTLPTVFGSDGRAAVGVFDRGVLDDERTEEMSTMSTYEAGECLLPRAGPF